MPYDPFMHKEIPTDPAVKRFPRTRLTLEPGASAVHGSFERLIMHLATAFVNAPPEKVDDMINEALRLSGLGAEVDRSYLMRYDMEKRLVRNTHEWCGDGIEPMIDWLQEVPFDGLEVFLEPHFAGDVLLVSKVEELREGSCLREVLEPQGILTMVAVPLMNGERCEGFVGFDAVVKQKEWSQEEIELLWILAEVFLNADQSVMRSRALSEAKRQAEMVELLLERAVLAGDFAIWELDLLVDKNRFLCGWNRLTGRDLDGRIEPAAAFFDMVNLADVDRFKKCVRDCLENSIEPFEVDFQMWLDTGELIDVRARWTVEYEEGRPVRLVGSLANIGRLVREREETRLQAKVESHANRISARFTQLDQFESAARAGFEDVLELTSAARISFWQPMPGALLEEVLCVVPHTLGVIAKDRTVVESGDCSCLVTLSEGQSVMLGPNLQECCGLYDWVKAGGNQSALGVPVRSEGRLDGILLVESEDPIFALSRPHEHLVQLMAHILAGALARNRAERELRRNREFYWMILESLSEAVLLTSLDGWLLYANEAWVAITGRKREEAIGLRLADLVYAEDVQKEEAAHQQALEGSLKEAYSLRLVMDRLGNVRWFKVMKKVVDLPILDGETGLLITLKDDTERHEWEESLMTAKVRAEDISEAKTLYLSKASHELRTPLHGILSLLELLKRSQLDLEQRCWAESAEALAQTLLGIFEDVLDVSKLERGAVKLKIQPARLGAMMENVKSLFEKAAGDKGLVLSLEVAASLPRVVEIDEMRTRQVLINLISNAIRYTSQGEVRVTVGPAERAGDDRLGLEFVVADTGHGIAPQDQEELFTPYVQLANHRRVMGEGSGLGLPIVRELCRLMDAKLEVESDGCTGTTMRFLLPTCEPIELASEAGMALNSLEVVRGKRVLVVEDNEISRYVAAEHLMALGGIVTTATDGREALEILMRQAQDLVVTDCSMPRMDGFELTRWIRSQPPECGGNCLILACTADSTLDNRRHCRETGMDHVLTKPYSRQQLQHAIEQVLSQSPLPSTAAPDWKLPVGLAERAILRLDLIGISLETDSDAAFAQLFLPRTFGMFEQMVPEELAKIRQALESGDAADLAKRLHHLKSSATAVGAEQLSVCCSVFEERARTAHQRGQGFPSEASVLEPLEQLVESCYLKMKELLRKLPS